MGHVFIGKFFLLENWDINPGTSYGHHQFFGKALTIRPYRKGTDLI